MQREMVTHHSHLHFCRMDVIMELLCALGLARDDPETGVTWKDIKLSAEFIQAAAEDRRKEQAGQTLKHNDNAPCRFRHSGFDS